MPQLLSTLRLFGRYDLMKSALDYRWHDDGRKGDRSMDEVFVYWDNSNIFHEAQRLADEEVPDARYRVRIHLR